MLASPVLQCFSFLWIMCTGSCDPLGNVTQLPKSTNSNQGTNVSFHCSLPFFKDGPPVNVSWWKQGDNKYLSTAPGGRILRGFKTKFSGFLTIINVSVQDSGVYYCTIAHRGRIVGNGTGSYLAVCVSPTPLKINSEDPEIDTPASLTVLCKTSPFYPQNISFMWYKDGTKTDASIGNIIQPRTDGLYEATSRLEEMQVVKTGTVYTCLVSHSTLKIEAMATHIVSGTGNEIIHYLLISASAGGWLLCLVLAIIIGKRCASKKNEGAQNHGKRSDYREQPTKQRAPDNKLTYAALDMTACKKTAKPNYKIKSTEYAQLQMKKQRADVIYMEQKAK